MYSIVCYCLLMYIWTIYVILLNILYYTKVKDICCTYNTELLKHFENDSLLRMKIIIIMNNKIRKSMKKQSLALWLKEQSETLFFGILDSLRAVLFYKKLFLSWNNIL
ncbi:hypothetical protein KUTeg_001540 [Tegillarca granosa]|uniref:ATP synthase F0 subunit 8 n=1 Tax=Tegillarca granosa TaxID=220873 RepID=A0ABQ9FRQ8_TEGGR|nr:hypothetical protein KUTeg_001540 [Tegillarca granosa]